MSDDATEAGPQWWDGEVLYQIYPRSYQDSDGDGVGDLRGILDRLDHLAWLGVRAIWLSPVTVSPNADFGYDVADYYDVDPSLGTLRDLDALVQAADACGIGVLMDLVPNHTSDRHPWFELSRSSRDNPKRDWYVWSDPAPDGGPPNNWVSVFGGSAWTLDDTTGQYYLHNFLDTQPDLNWWSEEVRDQFDRIFRYWFDAGVMGFRIDVAHMVVKDRDLRDNPLVGDDDPTASFMERMRGQRQEFNSLRPEVHDIHRRWREVADSYDPPRLLVGETFVERLDDLFPFLTGDQLHLDFNIPFAHAPFEAAALAGTIARTETVLDGGTPVWTGSNHDISRFPTRWAEGDPERARCALLMLLTLRGTVFLYEGDEIGMTDVDVPREELVDPVGIRFHPYAGRDPVRTPMQWTGEPGAGFTEPGVKPWLRFGDLACNVADQTGDPDSFLTLTRDLIAYRHAQPDLRTGAWSALGAPGGVLAYRRGDAHAVVLNLGTAEATVAGVDGTVAIGSRRSRDGEVVAGSLTLAPSEAVIVRHRLESVRRDH